MRAGRGTRGRGKGLERATEGRDRADAGVY